MAKKARKAAKKKTAKKTARKGKAKKAKRTTHRSAKGTKLYAVRDKTGKFKDIQTYKRAHGQDIKRNSKAEAAEG